jgi:hypothetical protein
MFYTIQTIHGLRLSQNVLHGSHTYIPDVLVTLQQNQTRT